MASSDSTETPPLAKYLASTDKKIRDKAVKNLSAFLSDPSRDAVPQSEMAKLWKGLFYCFWMSDKPLVQQALASELAELVLAITTTPSSLSFLSGFWEEIISEWRGIDRLRMDKYYMLVRRFVNASFRLLIRNRWDADVCEQYNSILTRKGGPLCVDDPRVPSSLAYHLADIYLEELEKAVADPSIPDPLPAPLSILLSPFFVLAARTPSKITYERIESSLLDPLYTAFKPSSPSEEEEEARGRKRFRLEAPTYTNLVANSCLSNSEKEDAMDVTSLRSGLLRRMFDVASEQDTRDSNRKKLYVLWRACMEENESERSLDAS